MIPNGCDKLLKVHSAELRRCMSAAAGLAETRGKARHIIFELGRTNARRARRHRRAPCSTRSTRNSRTSRWRSA
jgi:hypothetical protein